MQRVYLPTLQALLTQMKKWLGSETEWAAKLEAAKAAGREQGRRTVAGDLVWCNKIEGGLLAQAQLAFLFDPHASPCPPPPPGHFWTHRF